MSRTTRVFFNIGYVLVLAALVANGVVTYHNVRTIDSSDRWIDHTREVIIELERAASTLKDAETGQRGFLLTGDEDYLEPFRAATARMDVTLDHLAALTADNPSQQRRIAELKRLKAAKMEELRRTIALRAEVGLEAALAVVRTDRGRQVMDQARQVVVAMAEEEDLLLAQRRDWSRSATRRAIGTFALATGLVLGMLAVVFILKRREDFEQERSAEELRRSEAWLHTTLASIGDAVIATDERGRIRFLNPLAETMTGWRTTEAVGQPLARVFKILNEHSRQEVDDPVDKVLRTGTDVGLANHTILVARDGTERPIEDSAAPIKDPGGEIQGVVLAFRDATARREAERALRASEERLRLILESAEDYAILTLD
ncbi:MAG TPA: CHASE3 domain-containing protein, partial [Isosphaeraceae bacterium]